MHIVQALEKEEEFSIGRDEEEVDLVINDLTNSPIHAYLKFENGHWLLEDDESKYGTSVLMK